MNQKEPFIINLEELSLDDVSRVGGKNAALGEMLSNLEELGINVPGGFAVTAAAYRYFIESAGLTNRIEKTLAGLDTSKVSDLQHRGKRIRKMIQKSRMPKDLRTEVVEAYNKLGKDISVAVRSSATAEDLPGASFAGQQETFLNVEGNDEVIEKTKHCFASLFTDRAISYRVDKGFSHIDVALSVGVQRMVRTDVGTSGVAFTIDTETGFDNVVVINSTYGLGEYMVQGKVTPDEFVVFKPLIDESPLPIISRTCGKKDKKLIYGRRGTKEVSVPKKDQIVFSLSDDDVLTLADWCVEIERFFSEKYDHTQPMDIEWGKDGKTGELAILQARPETVHSVNTKHVYTEYRMKQSEKSSILVEGTAVGSKIANGIVHVIEDVKDIDSFKKGEILVTDITDPDWEPIMKIASAIVTDKGGRTSHAAIVSRELGIPCVVGAGDATRLLKTGREVTVDCASGTVGVVYDGKRVFEKISHQLDTIPDIDTTIMLNIGAPEEAFRLHNLPVEGVGLGRLEFIIASRIKIHPRALLNFKDLKRDNTHEDVVHAVEEITEGYDDKVEYYVEKLSEGIAIIAATFWPHPVIIRFSDFKTNEYRTLVGGKLYEPEEENPMIGWRGASRYYHKDFKEAFGLECKALKRVREKIGLSNVIPMVPFCRTLEEAERVISVMKEFDLDRNLDPTLKMYMMCEIPSNIILADQFLEIFDGFSIGSNDLTQLILGLDRDSQIVASVGDENDKSVKQVISDVIGIVKKRGKYIGICGQAPSDYPEFAAFLADREIDSISLSPDTVIKTITMLAGKNL